MQSTIIRPTTTRTAAPIKTAVMTVVVAVTTVLALPTISRAAVGANDLTDHALRAAQIEAQLAGADTSGPQVR